ncbi:MAG: hypothetical protein LBO66_10090 [Deltaproteobacteria bacterium]|jgi:hypothetical protein|nr:hypothetical protein [Deltaproteobacteria bacterium]
MTVSLHHVNQYILQLPATNGLAAAHFQAAEEVQRVERELKAQEYHRDVVEIVAELRESVAVNPVRPDTGERRGPKYSPTFQLRKKSKAAPDPYLAPPEAVIDRIV